MPHLVVGREYALQALEERNDGGLWFYVHTVEVSDFPYPYPAEMFELSVNAIPPGWCVRLHTKQGSAILKMVTFAKWANDEQFYERLVDGDRQAVSIYLQQLAG